MLGEEHSLATDFPEYLDVIKRLNETNAEFAEDNRRYTALDNEIRTLETQNSPIDDQEMHQLKHDRSELKDSLFSRLTAAK